MYKTAACSWRCHAHARVRQIHYHIAVSSLTQSMPALARSLPPPVLRSAPLHRDEAAERELDAFAATAAAATAAAANATATARVGRRLSIGFGDHPLGLALCLVLCLALCLALCIALCLALATRDEEGVPLFVVEPPADPTAKLVKCNARRIDRFCLHTTR